MNNQYVHKIKLPNELTGKFNDLWNIRIESNNKVIVFNKNTNKFEEKTIYRSYTSYMQTPKFDPKTKKSFMFVHSSDTTPEELNPFLEFAKSIDKRYNQMSINWYNPNEYIELHRDCTAKMVDIDADILIININESNDIYKLRYMLFENTITKELESIPLLNEYAYILKNNNTHRHAVGTGLEKRISITFRMIKD